MDVGPLVRKDRNWEVGESSFGKQKDANGNGILYDSIVDLNQDCEGEEESSMASHLSWVDRDFRLVDLQPEDEMAIIGPREIVSEPPWLLSNDRGLQIVPMEESPLTLSEVSI